MTLILCRLASGIYQFGKAQKIKRPSNGFFLGHAKLINKQFFLLLVWLLRHANWKIVIATWHTVKDTIKTKKNI